MAPEDDECMHGLDAGTCSLCKAAAMPKPVKKAPAPKAPRSPRKTKTAAAAAAPSRGADAPTMDNDCLVCGAPNPPKLYQCRTCGSATRAYQQAQLRPPPEADEEA